MSLHVSLPLSPSPDTLHTVFNFGKNEFIGCIPSPDYSIGYRENYFLPSGTLPRGAPFSQLCNIKCRIRICGCRSTRTSCSSPTEDDEEEIVTTGFIRFEKMDKVDFIKDGVISIAEVLLGGNSTVPVPSALDDFARKAADRFSFASSPEETYIDFSDISLARAIIATILPPLFWNAVGQFEYRTRLLSKLTLRPIIGVYLSGAVIASLSVYRSALFVEAIKAQPRLDQLDDPIFHAIGGFLGIFGLALFLGAYYQLGVCGTYLGDYFGILQDRIITAFPFIVVANPMYDGSSMFHLAEAIL